jgi:RimJ/RimL family protein N-acetyltransferase
MRALASDRLRLAPVTTTNARLLWEVLQAPGLRDYQDLPDVDLPQFKRMVASRPARLEPGAWGRFEWLIYIAGESEPIGWVSLRIGERTGTIAEVGYTVLSDYRNRGIATEAVGTLVGEAFRKTNVRRLRAYCVPDNAASRAVLERLGFVDDGILPHGATVQGNPVDVLALVLERSRWNGARTAEDVTRRPQRK